MRDRMIHAYFNVDYNLVWDTVINDVPVFEQTIQRLIEELDSRS